MYAGQWFVVFDDQATLTSRRCKVVFFFLAYETNSAQLGHCTSVRRAALRDTVKRCTSPGLHVRIVLLNLLNTAIIKTWHRLSALQNYY